MPTPRCGRLRDEERLQRKLMRLALKRVRNFERFGPEPTPLTTIAFGWAVAPGRAVAPAAARAARATWQRHCSVPTFGTSARQSPRALSAPSPAAPA